MTRKMIIGISLALTVLGGTAVYAGMGCNGGAGMFGENPDIEKVRTFQKETLTERDEMMIKRLELNQELDKKTPDKAKIETLRKEMTDLRGKLQESANRIGLVGGCLTDCNMDPVDCAKKDCGKHGCDKGGCDKHKKKHGKKEAGCKSCNKKK
jgi:hypothetical protein